MIFKSYARLQWALRKLKLPINNSDIVLDVGSGSNPHPRSDILLDRLDSARHRGGDAMLIDRPAVIGDAVKLPFKDKSIDFIIASHVLEHIPDPEQFLLELQRVGKAGYIEVPNFLCERMLPSSAHCLEIGVINGALHIHKKDQPKQDPFISSLNYLSENDQWKAEYFYNPHLFHVTYYWKDTIKYNVVNPETTCDWTSTLFNDSDEGDVITKAKGRTGWRHFGIRAYEFFEKKRRKKRLSKIDLVSLFACPTCRTEVKRSGDLLSCTQCGETYSASPFFNFHKKSPLTSQES